MGEASGGFFHPLLILPVQIGLHHLFGWLLPLAKNQGVF